MYLYIPPVKALACQEGYSMVSLARRSKIDQSTIDDHQYYWNYTIKKVLLTKTVQKALFLAVASA
jgi:hypothetical protein